MSSYVTKLGRIAVASTILFSAGTSDDGISLCFAVLLSRRVIFCSSKHKSKKAEKSKAKHSLQPNENGVDQPARVAGPAAGQKKETAEEKAKKMTAKVDAIAVRRMQENGTAGFSPQRMIVSALNASALSLENGATTDVPTTLAMKRLAVAKVVEMGNDRKGYGNTGLLDAMAANAQLDVKGGDNWLLDRFTNVVRKRGKNLESMLRDLELVVDYDELLEGISEKLFAPALEENKVRPGSHHMKWWIDSINALLTGTGTFENYCNLNAAFVYINKKKSESKIDTPEHNRWSALFDVAVHRVKKEIFETLMFSTEMLARQCPTSYMDAPTAESIAKAHLNAYLDPVKKTRDEIKSGSGLDSFINAVNKALGSLLLKRKYPNLAKRESASFLETADTRSIQAYKDPVFHTAYTRSIMPAGRQAYETIVPYIEMVQLETVGTISADIPRKFKAARITFDSTYSTTQLLTY